MYDKQGQDVCLGTVIVIIERIPTGDEVRRHNFGVNQAIYPDQG
ncbi:hypothetical protein CLV42_117110 [Chitinophaga ginsengisoli]|uniref:Uncharacterized protein n=1 Tax=Chitinophaga ginsengisoli TaxID=363837 RepID=A0A2P8FPY2_9BACT|nr:hypothetical protein CLV42_117110 [Chitinophaga ginsengisoli]